MIEVRLEGQICGALAEDPRDTGRMSFALFCPSCGRLWGRVTQGTGWYCVARPCPDEQSRIHVAGSFFQQYDWWPGFEFGAGEPGLCKFLRAHPRLLHHEFNVHLKWALQFIQPEPQLQQPKEAT